MMVVPLEAVAITLRHRNGETREVSVIGGIYSTLWPKKVNVPRLVIRWSIAGEYLLDLDGNRLIRGRRVIEGWHANDIAEAWRLWGTIVSDDPRKLRYVRGRDIVADLKKAGIPSGAASDEKAAKR